MARLAAVNFPCDASQNFAADGPTRGQPESQLSRARRHAD